MKKYEYKNYLAHHGVKGMKWGQHIFSTKTNPLLVSHRISTLANNRRNNKVRKYKLDYQDGKISKSKKKSLTKAANQELKTNKKKMMDDYNKSSNKTKSAEKLYSAMNKEVPYHKIKNGAKLINKAVAINNVTQTAAAGAVGVRALSLAGALHPATAAAIGGAVVAEAAIDVGMSYLVDKGISKLS